MNPNRFVFIIAACLIGTIGTCRPLFAQQGPRVREQLRIVDSTRIQVLTMRDGSSLVGRVSSIRADSIDFQMTIGSVPVAIADIRRIKETDAGSIHNGVYWFPNPNVTRLFFAPTGQMLKKGEGYFADYYIFFPGVAYGVTDNLSLGGGASIFPTGLDNQLYYFTPKVGMSFGEQIHLAAGLLLAGTNGGTGGVGYGVGTFGDGDGSVTLGFGYGFEGGEVESRPAVMLGGEKRISRHIGLVSENYLLPTSDDNTVFSFGLRFMGEKITVDLALVNLSDGNSRIFWPYLDFFFKF